MDPNKNIDKILVTGGTGLLGSHLIKMLVDKGFQVKAIYRDVIPKFSNAVKIDWIKADILDVMDLAEAMKNIDHVYHCAAKVSFNSKHKFSLFQTNVEGTANIVNACLDAGVKKLLFVSSVAALGKSKESGLINETVNWSDDAVKSEYGKSKYLAEMEVWRGIGEGLNAVIINPSTILGLGNWDQSSTAIFKSVYKEFPWFTEGVNGFVEVEDVVKAMILLMQTDIVSQRFIVSAVNISYKDLFDLIAKNFDKKLPSKKVTPFIASVVTKLEVLKGMLSGKEPLLTKETAHTALSKVYFDNTKLLKALPLFSYSPIEESVKRICKELKSINQL
jgi:dihydroflavonol-4-reductase